MQSQGEVPSEDHQYPPTDFTVSPYRQRDVEYQYCTYQLVDANAPPYRMDYQGVMGGVMSMTPWSFPPEYFGPHGNYPFPSQLPPSRIDTYSPGVLNQLSESYEGFPGGVGSAFAVGCNGLSTHSGTGLGYENRDDFSSMASYLVSFQYLSQEPHQPTERPPTQMSSESSLLNALGTEPPNKDRLKPKQGQLHGNLTNSPGDLPRNGKNTTPPCDQNILTPTQSTQNPESKRKKECLRQKKQREKLGEPLKVMSDALGGRCTKDDILCKAGKIVDIQVPWEKFIPEETAVLVKDSQTKEKRRQARKNENERWNTKRRRIAIEYIREHLGLPKKTTRYETLVILAEKVLAHKELAKNSKEV